jgi:hypothetical protein
MPTLQQHAPRAEFAPGAADDERWAHVWFTLITHGWRSLALVPAAPGVPIMALAEGLAASARAYHDGAVQLFDAQDVTPDEVGAVAAAVSSHAAAGERVLLALPSPLVRVPAIPLARAADAALLVVPLGAASARDARRVVAAVGHAHFLGSVTVPER